MDYKKMIESYAKNGGDEKKMWESVAVTEMAMDYIKETNPEKYECLMRKLHETLYGKHYNEELARIDVEKMHSKDASGVEQHGAHWTADQIETATSDRTFGKAVTKWDKYVAYNATWNDLNKEFDDEQILCAAYRLWFADEDWNTPGKIWDYMGLNK